MARNSAPYSIYIAADGYRDGGYRPFGAQNAQRAYIDLGYRTQDAEIHAIGSFGRSLLGVQGVTPVPLVNQQYNSVFTTPQTTNNESELAQLTAFVNIAPNWTLNSNFSTSAITINGTSTAMMPMLKAATSPAIPIAPFSVYPLIMPLRE
jgi:iron complex outermembrane recepter protein